MRVSTGRRIFLSRVLDVVRCVAILLAMGWHFNTQTVGILPIDLLLAPGSKMGWAGVDLFFVLSGFLIGGLIFSEYEFTGEFRSRIFMMRRALKIWPVFYAFLIIQLLVSRHPWETYLFQCLFHLQNYYHTSLPHLWSLAVEEHFYLIFSLGFPVVVRSKGALNLLPWILIFLMIFSFFARVFAVMLGVDDLDIQTQTQYRLDGLACGVLLAWVKHFRGEIFAKILSHKAILILIWLSNSLMLFLNNPKSDFILTFGYTFNYIGSSAFILSMYDVEWFARSRAARLMAWIGLFSYSMYVFQFVAKRPAENLALALHLTGTSYAVFSLVLTYGGAIIAAILVTFFIESPILKLRNWIIPSRSFLSHNVQQTRP